MNKGCDINKFQVIILLAFLITVAGLKCADASDMGPFNVAPIGLGEMFRETPQFIAPNDHKQGRVQVNISARWLNFWAYHMASHPSYEWENPPEDFPLKHGNFLVDMESYSLTHRISYKTSERVCAEITIPMVYQAGGCMDGFADEFHKAFGIDHNHRDKWPRNEIHGLYVTNEGQLNDYSDDIHGIFLGNVVIGGTYLLKSSLPSIGFRALCKLPTSTMTNTFDQNGVDFSFQASMTWNKNLFYGHHGVGVTIYGSDGSDGLNLKRERFSTFSALEYCYSDGFSIIAQIVSASAAADYPELNKPVVEVIFGFKTKIGAGTLEFGLFENMLYYDNSPDGGFHIGYTFSK